MAESGRSTVVDGLVIEAVEWLPSGADAGLVRVRGRWTGSARREDGLPALELRPRGGETRRFDSLPDARFGRDPAVWRGTYLVLATLMDPPPEALLLAWESGARSALPRAERGFEPPAVDAPAAPPSPEPGGEVIDRAVIAERRARRAEAAERSQARRAAEAIAAVEVLELRSAELERRLEALQAPPPEPPDRSKPASPTGATPPALLAAGPPPAPDKALTAALGAVRRLRVEVDEQRRRVRRSELLRAADSVALAALRAQEDRATALERQLAEAESRAVQAADQVAAARRRAAADAAAVRARAASELTAERLAHAGTREQLAAREAELADITESLAGVRAELERVRTDAADRAAELERRLAGLDAALAAERLAAGGIEALRAELALAEAARGAESVARAALDEQLDRERAARTALAAALAAARGETADARARIAALERELEHGRGTLEGVAASQRASDADLERRGREQAAAAAAASRPARDERRAVSEQLDAAAGTLRARAAEPGPAAVAAVAPAAPAARTAAARAPRAYPWLRSVLVRLAHDDPATATRLLLALVPAQRALLPAPLEYDLTIRGAGTYAVSVGRHGAVALPRSGRRPRAEAAFHVAGDITTLAELLAGVEKRMGRWVGSVRVRGRRADAEALRTALVAAPLDLAAAAAAGAELEPDLVFPLFPYAVPPSWTRGHAFTVLQEITGPRPTRWHVAIRDGQPVQVERRPPAQPPDAVVSMSRTAFGLLLRGAPIPSGERPAIRGDRAAVATLMRWTDRVQGR